MSDPERAENSSASTRSTHVAHLIPAAWPEVSARIAPLVARVDRAVSAVQVLVLVPTASDAAELLREVVALDVAQDVRIAPLASPRRARRLAGAAAPQVVIGTVAVISALIRTSSIALDQVTAVLLGAADELEAEEAALEQLLAEVPRAAVKLLTAAAATPFVERIMERHMHGARRVTAAPVDPAVAEAAVAIEVRTVSPGAPAAALADVLENVDAPSVAIVPADSRRETAARAVLASLGYDAESALVRMAPDGVTGGATLVVLLGPPRPAVLAALLAARPGRMVALVTARERSTLAAVAPAAVLTTFSPASALGEAAAAEDRQREQIRRVIRDGLPSREMLALEPLLADFDPLVLAGAALHLYERAQAAAQVMARKAADSARPAATAAATAAAAPRADRARERPPREEGGLRREGRSSEGPPRGKPPGDRGGRPSFGDRDRSGPPRERSGPPRERSGPPRDRSGPPRGRPGASRGPRPSGGSRGRDDR